jgi:hypothetical protein
MVYSLIHIGMIMHPIGAILKIAAAGTTDFAVALNQNFSAVQADELFFMHERPQPG